MVHCVYMATYKNITPDKELNILIYRTPILFHHINAVLQRLLTVIKFKTTILIQIMYRTF